MPSVLITSANRGIGLEFARQYLADGWQVYATCRHPGSASELRHLAEVSDHNLRILALDVTDPETVKAAAVELDGQAIDLLLNNAGIGGPRGQTIGNIDFKAWAKVLDVNTTGPMRVAEAFVDHVARSKRKLIVTLTSGMGSIADNTSGGAFAYRSSKAAVNMVMRSLAIDLAPRGITCVVVNPGWVLTDMGGTHATMTPAESVTRLRRLIETLGPASGKVRTARSICSLGVVGGNFKSLRKVLQVTVTRQHLELERPDLSVCTFGQGRPPPSGPMAQGGLMRPYLPAASHRLSQLKCSSAASLLSQRALTAMPRAKDAVAPR